MSVYAWKPGRSTLAVCLVRPPGPNLLYFFPPSSTYRMRLAHLLLLCLSLRATDDLLFTNKVCFVSPHSVSKPSPGLASCRFPFIRKKKKAEKNERELGFIPLAKSTPGFFTTEGIVIKKDPIFLTKKLNLGIRGGKETNETPIEQRFLAQATETAGEREKV
ncbi:hypothetical protein GGR58DRAFT_35812 [Xylaria digitata]|nr:hypothetical protein GGR58DRAFT_35812 [Xylaria digitata]